MPDRNELDRILREASQKIQKISESNQPPRLIVEHDGDHVSAHIVSAAQHSDDPKRS